MGRIKYGAFVTEINGSIGGTTFQRNAHGFTVRSKPNMCKPTGNKIQIINSYVTQVSTYWSRMSQVQRDAFNTYATTYPQYSHKNPSSILSGYNIFMKWNLIRSSAEHGIAIDIDIVDIIFVPLAPQIFLAANVLNLNLNDTGGDVDCVFAVQLSPSTRRGRVFPPSSLRFVKNLAIDEGYLDITVFYLNVFGRLPAVGDIIFARITPYGLIAPKMASPSYYRMVVE